MLMDRIMGALTFRKKVYAEVEKDVEFTNMAWVLVVVISLINQLGKLPVYGFGQWVIVAILGTVLSVAGFALGAFLISWAGQTFFKAEVNFGEMVRVLGLAYVWNIVGILGLLGYVPLLACILSPISFIAALAGLVSWVFACKEALDLDWVPTIVVLLIGWVANVIVSVVIIGPILLIFGIGASVVGNM